MIMYMVLVREGGVRTWKGQTLAPKYGGENGSWGEGVKHERERERNRNGWSKTVERLNERGREFEHRKGGDSWRG